MVDSAGVDLAGPTATRRAGTPENWLSSPEPLEPSTTYRYVILPPGMFGSQMAWGNAFLQSSQPPRVPKVVNTKATMGTCLLLHLPDLGTPVLL